MISTIVLYKNCKIIPTENYIVDNIDSYLLSLTKQTISNFQYIKHAFALSIKVNKNQSTLYFFSDSNNINYVSIKNGNDTYPVYYFVLKKTWTSEETISLLLQMDTINTFTEARNSFSISDRTLIHRQHKNRFKIENGHRSRNIDLYSEGILPKQYKKNDVKLLDDSDLNYDYYLIYKNSKDNSEDADNVVNCFLCSSHPFVVRNNVNAYVLERSDFPNGITAMYLENNDANKQGTISFINLANNISYTLNMNTLFGGGGNVIFTLHDDYIQITYNTGIINVKARYFQFSVSHTFVDRESQFNYYTTRHITYTEDEMISYNEFNKTSSKIIKIIKIPYLPSNGFSSFDDKLVYDFNIWNYDTEEKMLKLISLNTEFQRDLPDSSSLLSDVFGLTNIIPSSFTYNDIKVINRESKLFHSDYFTYKFYYDSFSKSLKMEYMDAYNSIGSTKYIFKPSRTINSRFIFKFTGLIDLFTYKDEDYPDILSIERNNEEVIYNSPYINYIRSGFNYDVKSKNRQEAFSWFTTIAGLIGGGVSLAVGSKTLGAGLVASSVISLASAINTTIQAENNLNSKMEQLRWQTNSVSNNDSIDLMSFYTDNRLHIATYGLSPKMEEVLYDLFFYTGYIEERQGIPDFNSRIWFNFVSCDLLFDEIKNIPDECLEDIINRYKGGVTMMHTHTINGVNTWDWARQYENWETIFFN